MFKYLKYCFLLCLFVLSACSVQKNYELLSFFFDGVPNPTKPLNSALIDSVGVDSVQILAFQKKIRTPDNIYHEPYRNKECADCHDTGIMGKLSMPQPELCYQCHEDFSNQYTTLHGPTGGGFCTECHNPHRSPQPKLLKLKEEDICFKCHNRENTLENTFHNIAEETRCLSCHNPHGGENTKVLQNGACFKCHDSFTEQYKFIHSPVKSGFCMGCHTTHTSGKPGLLAREGQHLCLHCHNIRQVKKNEVHEDIGDFSCTECHNPHGGEDHFILN